MGHMERPKVIVSNLEDLFPLTKSEIVLIFQDYPVHLKYVACDVTPRKEFKRANK